MEIWIPYGDTEVRVGIRSENLMGLAEPRLLEPIVDLRSEISNALSNPQRMKPLTETIGRDDQVVVAVDLPPNQLSSRFIDILILELRNLAENITVLWRGSEARGQFNTESSGESGNDVRILSDSNREYVSLNENIGNKDLKVSKEFAEASFRILVSQIGLDPVWGYTGGKIALLSVFEEVARTEFYRAAVRSYMEKTSFQATDAMNRLNSLVSSLRVNLMLNFVTSPVGDVARVFAGDCESSVADGANYVDDIYRLGLDKASEIIIIGAGGKPYDYTLYSSLDSVLMNRGIVKKDGAIILVAECIGGHGNDVFRQMMSGGVDPKQIRSMLKKDFSVGAEKACLLTNLLEELRVYLVSVMPDYYAKNVFRLKTARTVDDALQSALRILGKDSGITVVPRGSITQTSIRPIT